ncbi:TetR/AcrR family transcriptional regulator [Actinomycetospora straminea]|uniref:TetR/AcrR family transcriptional regulator n=1 Tax=Actinomycetospora straminea TaxID=663607 RepID=A0ABP9EDT5_9PSEU|nr:TetR/AcrR family transcriptional regulator [Actinomycetospora straminea]MDD7934378.1 TetR/AcrR family transcriptional regulator [Actinomycetospora straminea]
MTAPVRRRPRDRRAQILAAAAARFWSEGYHRVGMADVATAVGIAPSALYRHVRGKQELLLAILDEHLTRIEGLVAESATAPDGDLVDGLAALALERREFGLLWERESGHLPAEASRAIRHRLRGVAGVLAVAAPAPTDAADLRSWAALAVLDSPSHHRWVLDGDRFGALLAGAARAVLTTSLPPTIGAPAAPVRPAGLVPASRREALLAAATRLFGEQGYPAVGLGDIGAAAGIAGPSVYRYFATKTDLLLAALHRGNEVLWLGLHHALAGADDAGHALARLATDYTSFVAENPELISVLVSQTIHLPAPHRDDLRRSQRAYLAEWVALLVAARPDLPADEARVLVHAALALVNGLGRVHHLAVVPGARARTAALAGAVLGAAG